MNNRNVLLGLPMYGVLVLFVLLAFYFPLFCGTALICSVILWKIYNWIQYLNERSFTRNPLTSNFKVIIIGSGFGGVHAAIECKKNGIPYVVFEKNDKVGGTWAYNQYPGCACDVAAHLYAYSFEAYDWTSKYPSRHDIQKYIEHCVQKYGITKHIQLNTFVESIRWDKKNQLWNVVVMRQQQRQQHTGNVVISACGGLHVPNFPKISGFESFKGKIVHSSDMQSNMNYTNKRVAVIGSAASAIQLVPPIAQQAKKLYVFQRTPNWIIDKFDYKYPPLIRFLFKHVSTIQWLHRVWLYWRNEWVFYLLFSKNSSTAKLFAKQMSHMLKEKYGGCTGSGGSSEGGAVEVKDLIPNYPIGCKRILLSDKLEYYDTLLQKNVFTITDPIKEINSTGITTNKTHIEVDDIICATGFQVGKMLFTIEGTKGVIRRDLNEGFWGITFPGLPNFFMILGPNTALGHNSVVWISECQTHYIINCIKSMILHSIKSIEVKQEKVDSWYSSSVTPGLETKVWTGSCSSWYKDENGRVFALWPHSTFAYWWGLLKRKSCVFEDYHIRRESERVREREERVSVKQLFEL